MRAATGGEVRATGGVVVMRGVYFRAPAVPPGASGAGLPGSARITRMTPQTSFPRQYARTQRFSLGVPHAFRIAPDGSRIAYLRTPSGTDPSTCLWVRGPSGAERVVA